MRDGKWKLLQAYCHFLDAERKAHDRHAEAWLACGTLLRTLEGSLDQALDCFAAAFDVLPDDSRVCAAYASALTDKGSPCHLQVFFSVCLILQDKKNPRARHSMSMVNVGLQAQS